VWPESSSPPPPCQRLRQTCPRRGELHWQEEERLRHPTSSLLAAGRRRKSEISSGNPQGARGCHSYSRRNLLRTSWLHAGSSAFLTTGPAREGT
jgi:hypothetical protein